MPKWTEYIPHEPTVKQLQFLCARTSMVREVFYGGAAAGGKSDALLMGALQYVDTPGYAAILLRRTYTDLSLPEALMSRAREWLVPFADVHWDDHPKTWHFPSGATLTFGYLESVRDHERYDSAAFHYIGFDELTGFREFQYRYLFSRQRRLKGVDVPLRMRSASNPGGTGHEWVKQRFIETAAPPGREAPLFIPAYLDDNPHVDRAEYVQSLEKLDPVTRQQRLAGDWDIEAEGNKFKREWFDIVDEKPADMKLVRYWDLAATEPKFGTDPDYTVGALMGSNNGLYYVVDVQRTQSTPGAVEALIKQTAELDGKAVEVVMEQEPGSSGKALVGHYTRDVLAGWQFSGVPSTGSKEVRANPVSSQAEAGNIKLVRGQWMSAFLDEMALFPAGAHDDQVDAVSGAFARLTGKPQVRISVL